MLIVTTNAVDRIDGAFQRRMDVVIDFRAPDAPSRLRDLDRPPARRPRRLARAARATSRPAARCTAGRSATPRVHALLLALADGGTVTDAHVDEAVRREYRKAGEVCPLGKVAA